MVDTRFPVSVHIMTALAYKQPELMNSEKLARSIQTNPSFVRKLMVSLSAAGLVESVRGKAGGVRLAKNPKEISLDQIYKAVMDNALMAVPDKTPNRSCEVSCGISDVLCQLSRDIEDNTLKQLSRKTLKDIVEQLRK